jgi:trigger factor
LGEQITEKLVRLVQFEVSPRVVEAEADKLAENLKYQFERQGLQFDSGRFNSPELRASYQVQAEKNIRIRLVLDKIAETEQISLTDEEKEEIYDEIARTYGIDAEKVKREYADSVITEQSRGKKIEDKVLKFIEAEAVYVETPEEARDPGEADVPRDAVNAEEAKGPEQE